MLPAEHIITNATIIFAPDDIPRMNGPAIGLWKNTWSRKPDRDNAPPKIAAIRILGSRICQIIWYPVPSFRPAVRIPKISFTDMFTVPVLILISTIRKSARSITVNTAA